MPCLESIATKEIAAAAIAGSSAIAAVLLVFVGFMLAKAEALPSETDNKTIRRYELTAKFGIAPLLMLVMVTLAAYLWMFYPTNSPLFWAWSAGFVAGIAVFLIYCIVAVVLM
jgi:hypothetical protein